MMADMPDRNDRIRIIQCTRCGNTLLSSMFCTICGNGANVVSTEYLRSTPERERAGEMRGLLREIVDGVNLDESCTCYLCKAGRILATIEKETLDLDAK